MSRITVPTPTQGHAPSHAPPDMRYAPGLPLARCLGWFSIGLGLAQILAPKQMARLTGVEHPNLLKLFGLREIATGIGILNSAQPATWMWGRVVGDIADLATIGEGALTGSDEDRTRAIAAAAAVAGVLTLDVIAASELSAAAHLEG